MKKKEAYDKVIKEHSKSFSWAAKLFSQKQRHKIELLYYLCRTLDDIADNQAPDRKIILMNFRELIITEGKSQKTDKLVQQLYEIVQDLKLNREVLTHLLDGLIYDQGDVQLENEKQLINYCYRVAGTVGILMCPILGSTRKNAHKFAVDLGIGMQMTNIARDVFEDSGLNRRYLPGIWLNSMTATEIRKVSQHPNSNGYQKIQKAIHKLLDMAHTYYDSGRLGLTYLPLRSRFGIAVASNVYENIGTKIKQKKFDWGRARAYTSILNKVLATVISTKHLVNTAPEFPNHSHTLHYHLKEFETSW